VALRRRWLDCAHSRLPQVLLDGDVAHPVEVAAHGLLQLLHQRAVGAQAVVQRVHRRVVRLAQVGQQLRVGP
jgi:hypothetical protein